MKLSKLKKMKMPEKKGADMKGMEDMPEESGEESPEEGTELDLPPVSKEEASESPAAELEGLSDDDLLAEIKKRGLMAKLQGEGEEEADENSVQAY